MENLARYIIPASFSQERMTYIPEESKVLYRSKDGKKENVFDALEWPRRRRRDASTSIRSHACQVEAMRRLLLLCLEQGGADGQVLWLLQQCQQGENAACDHTGQG